MTTSNRFWIVAVLLASTWGLRGEAAVRVVPDEHATIQEAIEASVDGDSILVHPGVYFERIDFLGKRIHVQATGDVAETILDASGLDGSVVVFQSGEGAESILEGFTITGGIGTMYQGALYGGGVFCRGASPTLFGNSIIENSANGGGGLACVDPESSPKIHDNLLLENLAAGGSLGVGGGIFVGDATAPRIYSNSIVGNRAQYYGGAIYVRSREGVNISSNTIADSLGGGIFANVAQHLVIDNNSFLGNFDCAVATSGTDDLVLRRNRFESNRGAISVSGGDNVQIVENSLVRELGGGVGFISSTDVLVEGNVVWSPRATACALRSTEGVLRNNVFFASRGTSAGGGIGVRDGSTVEIVNCSVVGNSSDVPGAGLYLRASHAVVTNCIFWSNEKDEIGLVEGASVEVRYSVVEGGWEGEGNLDVDPWLANADAGGFHLRLGSPCIDAGYDASGELPRYDIDGDERLLDGDRDGLARIDIGADEHRWDLALRYGYVNQTGEGVLTVNESVGDHERVVRVGVGEPLLIALGPSSAGPDPARFVVYGWIDAPDVTTFTKQPFSLGWTVFPTPLQPVEVNQPVAIWNNLGRTGRLGTPTENSTPAPSTLLDLPNGVGTPGTVTLQGFIEDSGSRAAGPISITNAVVLEIEGTE